MTPLLLQMEEQPIDVLTAVLDVWTSERIDLSDPLPRFICMSHPLPLKTLATKKRFCRSPDGVRGADCNPA
jgi:hypothetical protein